MPTMVAHDRSSPKAVRVWLLGDFLVSVGERKVDQGPWRLRKSASLIKLLALAPSHCLHRERVMDLLWPESGKKAASNNLIQILHVARRALTSDPAEGSRYLTKYITPSEYLRRWIWRGTALKSLGCAAAS